MIEFFRKFFASDFLPHDTRYLGNPSVLWLNVVSDLAIGLAYYGIPVLLFVFVRKRKDFTLNWILLAFASFILACGTTHLLSAWTVWHATYELDGIVKAITAVASIGTAAVLAGRLSRMPKTEQLQREAELQEQAQFLELAHDGIIVRAWDGTIHYWNRGAELLYGWSRNEALGRRAHDLLNSVPVNLESIEKTIQEAGYWEGELQLTRRDGVRITVLSRWTARRTDQGPREILEVNRDITERKKFESALHHKSTVLERTNARFRQLLDSSPDGMLSFGQNGDIVQVNSQAERLFGYSREELVGQSIEILLAERSQPGLVQRRLGYTGEPQARRVNVQLELIGRRKDGREFPVDISVSPVETEEGTLLVSSVRDATERKAFERTLHDKNIELEKAVAAKDLFLAGMSHELRTPLNAIIGFAGTLLMRLAGPLTPDQDRQLKTIEASGKHLLALINDILDLAKIESGSVSVDLHETPCLEVLEDVVCSLRPLAEAKSIGFEVKLPEQPLQVMTHRRAFSQIVFKLGCNAIKYTEQGWVRLEIVTVARSDQRLAAVHVIDTGSGLTPEEQENLLRILEQETSEIAASEPGLGLRLCHKLADLIGGRIEFESEYGKGSRFTLLVPQV